MLRVRSIWIAIACLLWAGGHLAAQVFAPIPEADKPLYHFNFKLFYSDEAARQVDLAKLRDLESQAAALKTEAGAKPQSLLRAVEMRQATGIIADKLKAAGMLRMAVNTADAAAKQEFREACDASNETAAATAFVQSAVWNLPAETVDRFQSEVPELSRYRYLFETWRRGRPHALPPSAAALESLDAYGLEFYTRMLERSPRAILPVNGNALNVTKQGDYAELLHFDNRAIREAGFRRRMATYKAQANVFAAALIEKARHANQLAASRHFENAIDADLFEYRLSPEMLDHVLDAFRRHAALAIRFEKANRAYQRKLLGLKEAEPWDDEARSAAALEPRFSIRDASRAVTETAAVFGKEYQAELAELLDPRNGRLDIVVGPNRQVGDFTWGAYGSPWVFYMQGYNGRLADLVLLAHESTHAVHYSLIQRASVPWCYGDGARYFSEGFAKLNELLVIEHLAKDATNDADRLFYLRELNSKLTSVRFFSMYWAAFASGFEVEVYRRVKSGAIQRPEQVHELWAEFGKRWSSDFERFPDLKYAWPDTHHFFDVPRYYSNYLFAWVFAVGVYERLQTDPTAADKVVQMMKAGFSDDPAKMLRRYMGLSLADPKSLDRMFVLAERRLGEFEKQVQDMDSVERPK